MDLIQFRREIETLVIFHHILEDEFIQKVMETIENPQNYYSLCSLIYNKGANLSDIVYKMVMNDENMYVLKKAEKQWIPDFIEKEVNRELVILQNVCDLTSADFQHEDVIWENTHYELQKEYLQRILDLPKKGYGIFAKYYVFGIDSNGLYPIQHPDTQTLSSMTGYEQQRNLLIKNTLALLQGMNANNALLYGDAGTGKSSTIKAIVNEYHNQGLRLIEVKKKQIALLPSILETLANNPLKFIVFIDDLSFSSNDDDYIALKNILEGSTTSNKSNVVIYATSNRRHFMKENFSDRTGDELHRNDTIQETMSLAARFGLTITFQKPGSNLYLEIVKQYAKDYGLNLDEKELKVKAEAFAIRNNGRSARTAKQFVEFEKINQTFMD
ncbi:ATP-binding protein [Floccifex sp.]|uniref:ATP-binding protein n=1 Tax=Floccifex sp. TaxID=2815810 RepID=UPI003F0C5D2F